MEQLSREIQDDQDCRQTGATGLDLAHGMVFKIQQWKVETQMDLDAKNAQVRQYELLLQQQNTHLQEEQRRASLLQNQVQTKCKDAKKLQDDLRHQVSVNKILEDGMQKLDSTLQSQEDFIQILKNLSAEKQRELVALKKRLDELQEILQLRLGTKQKENEELCKTVAMLKEDLMKTLESLKEQSTKSDRVKEELASVQEKLDKTLEKLKILEDTVDYRDRDIDIIKSHHAKETDSLMSEITDFKTELSFSDKKCQDLNLTVERLTEEKNAVEIVLGTEKEAHLKAKETAEDLARQQKQLLLQFEHLQKTMESKEKEVRKVEKEKADEISSMVEQMSMLEKNLQTQETSREIMLQDVNHLKQQKSTLEEELKEIKKVHNVLKLLRIDYEKAINDIQVKEAEIQKLRQIQVEKLDQEEEIRQLKKKQGEVEDALFKAMENGESSKQHLSNLQKKCDELKSVNSNLEGKLGQITASMEASHKENDHILATLKATLKEKEASVASLKSIVLEKEDDLEKFRGESLDLARDVEEKYKQYLDIARKDKSAVETELLELKVILDMKEKELQEQLKLKTESSRKQKRKTAPVPTTVPKVRRSRTMQAHDFDPSAEEETNKMPENEVVASGDSYKIFRSRNKCSLDYDFDAVMKTFDAVMKAAGSKPKTYEQKERKKFFSRKKSGDSK